MSLFLRVSLFRTLFSSLSVERGCKKRAVLLAVFKNFLWNALLRNVSLRTFPEPLFAKLFILKFQNTGSTIDQVRIVSGLSSDSISPKLIGEASPRRHFQFNENGSIYSKHRLGATFSPLVAGAKRKIATPSQTMRGLNRMGNYSFFSIFKRSFGRLEAEFPKILKLNNIFVNFSPNFAIFSQKSLELKFSRKLQIRFEILLLSCPILVVF